MENCIFCKIINKELPSYEVYSNDYVYAFLDINPVNYGHTLVVPKKHYENLEEITEEDLKELIIAVKKIGKAIKDGLNVSGYNIGINNGSVAGQIVPHLHFHIIPRFENDGIKLMPQRKYIKDGADEYAEKIRKALK